LGINVVEAAIENIKNAAIKIVIDLLFSFFIFLFSPFLVFFGLGKK
jgi:hypothetical protein